MGEAIQLALRAVILLFMISAHEAAHVLVAGRFGVRTEKVRFTPLGEIAVMKDFVFLQPHEKVAAVLAGPFANLAMGLVCALLLRGKPAPPMLTFFRDANLAIGFFNLLPAYPLDGGRLLALCLERKLGVLPVNNAVYSFSRFMSAAFIFFGFVQVVLYPYNFSLICMGLYSAHVGRKLHFDTAFDFYRHVVFGREKLEKKRGMPVKAYVLPACTPVKMAVAKLGYDSFFIFKVTEKDGAFRTLTETDLAEHVKREGLRGDLQNLLH